MKKSNKEVSQSKMSSNNKYTLPSRVEVHGHKYKKQKSGTKKSSEHNNGKIYRSFPVILLLILFLLPVTYILIINKDKVIEATPINRVGEVISFAKNEETDTKTNNNKSDSQQEKPAENDKGKTEAANNNASPNQSAKSDEEEKAQAVDDQQAQEEQKSVVDEEKRKDGVEESKVQEVEIEKEEGAYHIVQPGETLYRISVKYYQSQEGIDKIRNANGITENEIKVGQKLIIP